MTVTKDWRSNLLLIGISALGVVLFCSALLETARLPLLTSAGLLAWVVLLLLTLAFRTMVVPALAALCNLLAVAAAYGILVLIFQEGWGVELLGLDTYSDEASFFSYRRATHRGEPTYGRQFSLIGLPA